MTMEAAEGRAGLPGASPEGSGRKPREHGMDAASVTARPDRPRPEVADRLMEIVLGRENLMAA